MDQKTLEPIHATVISSDVGCVIGINAQEGRPKFIAAGGRLTTQDGREVQLPDAESHALVFGLLKAPNPRVFIVEFGPLGPLAEHDIQLSPSGA